MPGSHASVTETTDRSDDWPRAPTIAALDLGSNSFHMIVAEVHGHRLKVLDRVKDMVRLAAGLDPHQQLEEAAIERGLASLSRMAQRIRELPEGHVRVVGTNTLRKARNGAEFVARAQTILGHEVEIISGREEARLIYLGVSHALEDHCDRRLVVDIGGGSTELALGRRFQPEVMDSLYMGCVSMSERFFAEGRITAAAMEAAGLAALHELEPLMKRYRRHGWEGAIGTSGTILAIQEVIASQGLGQAWISREALRKLQQKLIRLGHVDKLNLSGLPSQRAPVFPGGVAILAGIFDGLDLDSMRTSTGALREGLLWDLLGRHEQADIREATVRDLELRYHVDGDQAGAVEATVLTLFNAVRDSWQLTDPDYPLLLRWGARLHEIGMDIAYSQYHKHGAYLLQHMDMPGFSRTEQHKLALLVRAHRRKFPRGEFNSASLDAPRELSCLALLLRCAIHLHRSRDSQQAPPLTRLQSAPGQLALNLDPAWLDAHPLTRLDLTEEVQAWQDAGLSLRATRGA